MEDAVDARAGLVGSRADGHLRGDVMRHAGLEKLVALEGAEQRLVVREDVGRQLEAVARRAAQEQRQAALEGVEQLLSAEDTRPIVAEQQLTAEDGLTERLAAQDAQGTALEHSRRRRSP